MADKKVSAMDDGAPAQGADQLMIARGGASYRVDVDDVAAYASIDAASDTDITAAAEGEILTHDGSNWVDQMPSTLAQVTEAQTTGTPALAVHGLSNLDATGGTVLSTLAVGTIVGQRKVIIATNVANLVDCDVASHANGPTTFTFNNANDYVILEWMGASIGWITIDATATV